MVFCYLYFIVYCCLINYYWLEICSKEMVLKLLLFGYYFGKLLFDLDCSLIELLVMKFNIFIRLKLLL